MGFYFTKEIISYIKMKEVMLRYLVDHPASLKCNFNLLICPDSVYLSIQHGVICVVTYRTA